MATTKSAIKEVRDQLYVDTADGKYLSALGSNYGLVRPKIGFGDDDIWRAVVRRLALDYKQVVNVFYDLLTNIFGPRISVATALASSVAVDDVEMYVADWMKIPQRGTMILDSGLVTQETVDYTLRDPSTGLVTLKTGATKGHTALQSSAVSYLTVGVSAGLGVSITVEDGSLFPDPAVVGQYAVLIDAGLPTEEVGFCTSKSGDVLVIASLAYDHSGPSVLFANTAKVSLSSDKRLLVGADVDGFEAEGILHVQATGGSPNEYAPYSSMSYADKAFDLRRPLVNNYTTATTITKAKHGSSVQLAQVLVMGVGWNIFQTEDYKVKIYFPPVITRNRLVDAPFLHDRVATPPSTTVASGASIGDLTLALTSGTGFPDSGLIKIDAAGTPEDISYSRINRITAVLHGTNNAYANQDTGDSITVTGSDMTLAHAGAGFTSALVGLNVTIAGSANPSNDGTFAILSVPTANSLVYDHTGITESSWTGTWFITGLPKGATTIYADQVRDIYRGYDNYKITSLVIGEGTANVETVTISSIDIASNSIVLSSGTTKIHALGEVIRMGDPNLLILSRALEAAHSAGQTVDLWRVYLPGTTVEDGTVFSSDPTRFQGKYLWSFLERVAQSTKTSLAADVSGPTYLEVGQLASRTAIEVRNAALFNTTDLSLVQIGDNLASREVRQINDITLKTDITGRTLAANALAGDTSIQVNAGTNFPEADGYRLFIANTLSSTAEEVVVVRSYNPTTQVMTLDAPLVSNHNLNEPVQLMSDVLTVDALTNDQDGVIPYAQRYTLIPMVGLDWSTVGIAGPLNNHPALINELLSYITVVDASDAKFSASGEYILINFGQNKLSVGSQLASDAAAGSGTLTLLDASKMPSTNFWVRVGDSNRDGEIRKVSSRTGNVLTLLINTDFPHAKYEWVTYLTGEQEEAYFTSKSTGGASERFNFDPPIYFDSAHYTGEPVAASQVTALPSKYGTDFPFYLPSSWSDRLEYMFDLARAAGVQIVMVSDL